MIHKLSLSISLTALLSFSPLSQADNQAVLIGINQYSDVLPILQGTEVDVANIKNLAIKKLGYKDSQIHVLQDQEATKKNILQAIRTHLIKKTKAGDQVLFYFSGHGYHIKDINGDEKDHWDETLVTYDTTPNKDHTFSNMITDDELGALFDQIDDRKVTIIVDACHSGTITRGLQRVMHLEKTIQGSKSSNKSKSVNRSLKDIGQRRQEESFLPATSNRVVWSAVSAQQKALIDFSLPTIQSVFTRWFTDGLMNQSADKDDNNKVSNAELLAYTRKKSKQHCQQDAQCQQSAGLTPELQANSNQMPASLITPFEFSPPTSEKFEFATPPAIPSNTKVEPEILPTEYADSALPLHNEKSITIDVEVNSKKTHKIKYNSSLLIAISSERAGHLLLLDRDAKGQLTQLYPNPSVSNNFIKKQADVFIPNDSSQFEIKATEIGESQLIAIVTHDNIKLDDLMGRANPVNPNTANGNQNLAPIPNQYNYLNELSQRIHATWTGGEANRAIEYSIAKFDYTVQL